MYKKILFIVLMIIFSTNVYSANVDLTANVYSEYTIFNYIFNFDKNKTIEQIAFEKPINSTIDYIVDKSGALEHYTSNNDIIIGTKEINNNVFLIKLKSKTISEQIFETESFRVFQNFKFNVDNFNFKVIIKDDIGEILNAFPNNYTKKENEIEWNQKNISQNSIYIINFKTNNKIVNNNYNNLDNYENYSENQNNNKNYNLILYSYITISILLLLFILIIILFLIYPKYLKKYLTKKDNNKNNNIEKNSNIKNNNLNIENNNEENNNSKKEKNIYEIIEKHLTENEKNVVEIIKEKEGISQQDVLNYLPSLTKSNLSKILSKLNSKRILKRIKVGKINNIYLGEKLKPEENNISNQKEEK